MTGFTLSPRGRADLDAIWTYTSATWSVDQPELYLRQIKTAVEAVAARPALARSCDDVRPGYRRYPVGSHVLFLRSTLGGIEIVRILHQRMDAARYL